MRGLTTDTASSEDATKLAETLQRVVEIRREHGTKLQVRASHCQMPIP